MGCPLCRSADAHDIYALDDTPATCTSVFDSVQEAQAVPAGRIDLVVCTACGFAYNRSFDRDIAAVGARYESTQAASAHFSRFARDLAASWVQRYRLTGKTVIEVGCGQGEFLEQMLLQGAQQAVGIDPLAPVVNVSQQCRFLQEVWSEAHVNMEAAALVCRHTLEHVPDVIEFLLQIRRWASGASDRVVLFELPAADAIFEGVAFWDIYYEHCNYFTEQVVRHAFARAGFQIMRCERVYGGQYFVVEAVASSPMVSMANAASELFRWREFAAAALAAIGHVRGAFTRIGGVERPFVIWQGAAKAVGVLTACGRPAGLACAVDLNPGRHGRYLPGSGLPVQAPVFLESLRPSNVVLMNAVYRSEVQQILEQLKTDARLWSIDELCALA